MGYSRCTRSYGDGEICVICKSEFDPARVDKNGKEYLVYKCKECEAKYNKGQLPGMTNCGVGEGYKKEFGCYKPIEKEGNLLSFNYQGLFYTAYYCGECKEKVIKNYYESEKAGRQDYVDSTRCETCMFCYDSTVFIDESNDGMRRGFNYREKKCRFALPYFKKNSKDCTHKLRPHAFYSTCTDLDIEEDTVKEGEFDITELSKIFSDLLYEDCNSETISILEKSGVKIFESKLSGCIYAKNSRFVKIVGNKFQVIRSFRDRCNEAGDYYYQVKKDF